MRHTATTASSAACSLVNTTATFAIYGCPTKNPRTTVRIAVSVALEVETIFVTATTVACALTRSSLTITIARAAST